MRGRGWVLVSATVDHAARLPFCTKDSISLFTHPSCEVGTRFGNSMGVTSALLNWEPSKIPADKGSMNSLRRTPPMWPRNSSRWGMICEDRLLPVLYSGLYVLRYKIVFVPEWFLCPVRSVLVGVYGLTVVRGRALFVVFGFLY